MINQDDVRDAYRETQYQWNRDIKLKGAPMAKQLVDELFRDMLKKYEKEMITLQNKLLVQLKKENESTFKEIKKSISKLKKTFVDFRDKDKVDKKLETKKAKWNKWVKDGYQEKVKTPEE